MKKNFFWSQKKKRMRVISVEVRFHKRPTDKDERVLDRYHTLIVGIDTPRNDHKYEFSVYGTVEKMSLID